MRSRLIIAGLLMVIGLVLVASCSASKPAPEPSASTSAVAQSPTVLPTATPTPTPTPTPTHYGQLTARAWALIAKDPASHIGEAYVVYGVVTQFDAATGADTFRANVDGIPHSESYRYPTNTVLTGDPSMIAQIVQGDSFTAKVEVRGAIAHNTQIGGSTTAPQLQVDSIQITTQASP